MERFCNISMAPTHAASCNDEHCFSEEQKETLSLAKKSHQKILIRRDLGKLFSKLMKKLQ